MSQMCMWQASSASGLACPWLVLCRFVFVLDGSLNITVDSARAAKVLHADEYAYIPADTPHTMTSHSGAGLLLFERRCVIPG